MDGSTLCQCRTPTVRAPVKPVSHSHWWCPLKGPSLMELALPPPWRKAPPHRGKLHISGFLLHLDFFFFSSPLHCCVSVHARFFFIRFLYLFIFKLCSHCVLLLHTRPSRWASSDPSLLELLSLFMGAFKINSEIRPCSTFAVFIFGELDFKSCVRRNVWN